MKVQWIAQGHSLADREALFCLYYVKIRSPMSLEATDNASEPNKGT